MDRVEDWARDAPFTQFDMELAADQQLAGVNLPAEASPGATLQGAGRRRFSGGAARPFPSVKELPAMPMELARKYPRRMLIVYGISILMASLSSFP